ncbi:MAG: hypothetical protein JNK79_02710 [Chitinophagaceae bacterium]|nr:hypothetical protein [Chitinophagaceae bacterium]
MNKVKNNEVVVNVFKRLINEKKANDIGLYYVPDVIDHSAWPGQLPGRDGLKKY